MAEINSSENHSKKGISTRSRKKSTKVDLTPMVDLGFLLITFFIFTTTINQPTTMKLILPNDTGEIQNPTITKVSGALTLLLANENQVKYYQGDPDQAKENLLTSTITGIRNVILKKKRSTIEKDLYIIIKPSQASTYKNVVDILDEMTINDIKRYALVDITSVEEELIAVKN